MQPTTDNSYVVFHLAGEEYALPVSKVNSIVRYEESTPVPRSPEIVMGVINLRGRIIPVVDLLRRFKGRAFVPGVFARIIVAEGAVGAVGLAVDSAKEVVEIPPEDLQAVPEGVLSPETARAFAGVVEREGSLVILLDLDEAIPRTEYAVGLTDEQGDSNV